MLITERLKIIGRRVQELRRDRNKTQAELAEMADLSTNYVGEIERGETQATLETLLRIADALEVNPSNLFVPLDRPESRVETIARIRELLDRLSE